MIAIIAAPSASPTVLTARLEKYMRRDDDNHHDDDEKGDDDDDHHHDNDKDDDDDFNDNCLRCMIW